MLGKPLPEDARPRTTYAGPLRVIVPTVRSSIAPGEAPRLKVLILSGKPASGAVHWREIGKGDFAEIPLTAVARGVYRAEIPARKADVIGIEYFVKVSSEDGQAAQYPASAPGVCQTVVVEP